MKMEMNRHEREEYYSFTGDVEEWESSKGDFS